MRWLACVLLLAACARPAEPVLVTYWYLDFCSACRATREGLTASQKSRADFQLQLIDHRAPGAAEAIRALGFQRHGLVVRRGDEVLLKQADHRVRLADVEVTLAGGPP
ncbi:MAG: hypothetical protein DI536_16110 [Archangium gephyra]|uniref:Uncharacterized protein n=1 Tax=Archangium gephyra TaxID=48 RepID=A0A2W5URV9_9BACT|nr:MAG: hypothetical protein DI536_16110 [Archangium gephyra]